MKILQMRHLIVLLALISFGFNIQAQKIEALSSPDGTIKVTVSTDDKIRYSVAVNDMILLKDNILQMQIGKETLGEKPSVSSRKLTSADEIIRPVVAFKSKEVRNHYNQLTLNFKGNYSVEFRAYDDGIAYRFITRKKGVVEVMNEVFDLSFAGDYLLHTQFPGDEGFNFFYESPYSHVESKEWKTDDKMSGLPVLIDTRKGVKILVSEADLIDYPCLFLKGKGAENGVKAVFSHAPIETQYDKNGRNIRIARSADYIAKTQGARSFPWRWFVIAKNDGQLIESTMNARLAPHTTDDFSWVKPDLSMWDWMNRHSDFGPEVNYSAGVNTAAYKHYIDFAARNNIPYLILDEGWSVNNAHPKEVKKEVDLEELVRYGRMKNVGLLLWITFSGIQEDFDDDSFNLFEHFSKMGIVGFKIDFMDRNDQWIVNFYEKAAAEAAKYHMLVELHGSYKPTGMEFRYPNVLSYEGVRGFENGGNCIPDNSLYLPFMRNVTGPMSFTPGAMINVQPEQYNRIGPNLVMKGTRAQHIAYYILFESGLQMIADCPRQFDMNPDCRDFIFSTPVTWDETHALAAEAGQYAIVARRNGEKWWLGGITNNAEKQREFDLTLDFLPSGKSFSLTAFEDGPNAERQAMDYNVVKQTVKKGDRLHIKLARNGGYAAVLEEAQ